MSWRSVEYTRTSNSSSALALFLYYFGRYGPVGSRFSHLLYGVCFNESNDQDLGLSAITILKAEENGNRMYQALIDIRRSLIYAWYIPLGVVQVVYEDPAIPGFWLGLLYEYDVGVV